MAIITSTELQPVTTKTRVCDFCGKPASRSCQVCKRDVCGEHTVLAETDPFYQLDNGDYPDVFCRTCNGFLARFSEDVEAEHKRHNDAIEKMRRRFQELALTQYQQDREITPKKGD